MKTKVHVIRVDRTGDTAEDRPLESFIDFPWQARKEVITVDDLMVLSYDELMEAVVRSPREVPEVVLFPPLVGG